MRRLRNVNAVAVRDAVAPCAALFAGRDVTVNHERFYRAGLRRDRPTNAAPRPAPGESTFTEEAAAILNGKPARKPRTSKPVGQVRTGDPQADRAIRDAATEKDAAMLAGLVPEAGSPEAAEDKEAAPKVAPARAEGSGPQARSGRQARRAGGRRAEARAAGEVQRAP